MKEVKSPKKPLLYYYGIVLLIIIVFNVLESSPSNFAFSPTEEVFAQDVLNFAIFSNVSDS